MRQGSAAPHNLTGKWLQAMGRLLSAPHIVMSQGCPIHQAPSLPMTRKQEDEPDQINRPAGSPSSWAKAGHLSKHNRNELCSPCGCSKWTSHSTQEPGEFRLITRFLDCFGLLFAIFLQALAGNCLYSRLLDKHSSSLFPVVTNFTALGSFSA